ncbi:unnamed protein product [Lactuca saligna]|uniref:Uncharacterized protein n=1 Tax=Lactuca saligna TaxID=75948 RepID=A0AA36A2A4_LACSI|nr:unnamed protein product [Lactuca saligna]
MFRDVPTASKILDAYRKLPVSGFLPLTDEKRVVLDEADKPNKVGKKKAEKEAPPPTKKQKIKKIARNPYLQLIVKENPMSTNLKVTFRIPISIPVTDDFFDNVSVPSHTTNISTPIFIAPCLPVLLGVSQPPPIFTDYATAPTTTIEPPISINASDAGAGASGLATGHSTPPISPLHQNDPYMNFGDDDNFAGFTYSPFNIKIESDDKAPIMRGKLKEIHKKLDSFLHATKKSSTDDYSKENFQSSLESNTVKANEVISSLGSTLKTEKAKLQDVSFGLKSNHDEFQSSISLKITKLQNDLAMESKIMDALSVKTEKLEPVVSFELQNKQDSQLDLPITPKAFKFCSFLKIANVPSVDNDANQLLFLFYLKHMKPQYETWSASKIIAVKVTCPIETESLPNAKFKFMRGFASRVQELTLADLPCLNPYDSIMLYNLLQRDAQKYEPVIAYLKLMVVSYVKEVGKMDTEIDVLLCRKPSVLLNEVEAWENVQGRMVCDLSGVRTK